jgi:hypothetical protein
VLGKLSLTSPKVQSRSASSLLWMPSAFVLAALGPYLGSGGFKVEHIIIYGTFCAYTLLLPAFYSRPWAKFSPIMHLWLWLGISQLLGFVWSSSLARTVPPTGRLLAAVEHQIQPLVIVCLVCAWARTLSGEQLAIVLRRALNLLIGGLCLNSLLIAWFMKTGNTGVFLPWLPPSGAAADSVWSLSIQMGRFGGIFNQPFEAGLSYSLALLGWCRIQGDRGQTVSWEYGRLVLLLFGGLMSISKVFILGGIPLCAIFSLLWKPCRKSIFNLRTGAVLIGVFLVAASYFQEVWTGFSFFMRLFSPERGADLVDLYTANRFGGDPTQVTDYFSGVWKASPLFGFGFAPYEVIDNGFLWAFASGGILGTGIFILMLYRALAWSRKLMRTNREQLFSFMMILLMVVAAVGAPSLTINRASTIFWTLYPLATLVGLARCPQERGMAKSRALDRFECQERSPENPLAPQLSQ